jgi:ligand-binding sensor domain-containing protein
MSNYVHIVRLLIVFSFLFISDISFPQYGKIQFEHITIEDGLSQKSVICILQDTRGFLWIGTSNGLNKYDGYNFTKYRYSPNDQTSLSSNNNDVWTEVGTSIKIIINPSWWKTCWAERV